MIVVGMFGKPTRRWTWDVKMDHRVINYAQDLFSVAGTGAGGVELQFCCQTYYTNFSTCLD